MMVELDVLPAPVMPTGRSTTPVSLACECDAGTNYIDDGLGGCILAVCIGPRFEGSKNVMVELDVLPAPVMPTGDQLLLSLLIVM